MGCDIHIHFEYKNSNGEWTNCDRWKLDPYLTTREEYDNSEEDKYWCATVDYNRNYDAFSILAGVRGSFEQIKELEGLPEDMHWLTKQVADKEKYSHSHTWYTLDELLEWRDKEKKTWKKLKKNNVVKKDNYYNYVQVEDQMYTKKHHMLDWIIRAAEHTMEEDCYCFNEQDIRNKAKYFRIIMWFDS